MTTGQNKMTYTQAKMICHNTNGGYSREQLREAAVTLLARWPNVTNEDYDLAAEAVRIARKPEPTVSSALFSLRAC
jgi:hypothetical protein